MINKFYDYGELFLNRDSDINLKNVSNYLQGVDVVHLLMFDEYWNDSHDKAMNLLN